MPEFICKTMNLSPIPAVKLVSACLAKLRKAGIQKCNVFIFANNATGMKFWAHTGWSLRRELRLMQIRLDDGRRMRRDRSC